MKEEKKLSKVLKIKEVAIRLYLCLWKKGLCNMLVWVGKESKGCGITSM